jgi:hypothetical protein
MKKLAAITAIGFAGGTLVASLLLSFISLIGELGDTGSRHAGYWEPAIIGLGLMYGGPSGAAMVLVLRIAFPRLGFKRFIGATIYAGLAALVIGAIGGRNGPGAAALFCISAFVLIAISIILVRQMHDKRSTTLEIKT